MNTPRELMFRFAILLGAAMAAAPSAPAQQPPALAADLQRLEAVEQASRRVSRHRPEEVATLAATFAALRDEYNALCRRYADRVKAEGANSEIGRRVYGARDGLIHAVKERDAFLDGAATRIAELAQRLDARVTKVLELGKAELLLADNDPAARDLQEAQTVLQAWTAWAELRPDGLDAAREQLDRARQRFDRERLAADEALLRTNRAPQDVYAGADKAALTARLLAAWRATYPQDEVLGLRFHAAQWSRKVSDEYDATSRSLRHLDRSVLTVTVIVKVDERVAMTFPAYVNRDNLDDTITLGVATKGPGYLQRRVLLANL